MQNLNLDIEKLKSKISVIIFVYSLMIGWPKKNREIIRENAFEQTKRKPWLNFNPGLALFGLRTTGPSTLVDGFDACHPSSQN